MAKITWLEATKAHTSRARRRNLRKEARLKAQEEEKRHRENAVMENGCSNVVFKALYLPTSFREPPAEISKNEDASFHVVNHAHQRSPRKKWS